MKVFFRSGTAVLAIVTTGLAAYANTWQSPFHFDDQTSIVWNHAIQRLADMRAIWDFWPTRFLTYFSFAINYHIHQLGVFGYHVVNTAIHLCAALCVRWLVLLTWRAAGRGPEKEETGRLVALFAALIFVAHPIQTQAVTYITQRAASLAGLLYLGAVCFYVRSRLENFFRRAFAFYAAALSAGLAAMFAKEVSVTLPLALALHEALFLSPGQKKPWGRLAPFFALACVVPLVMALTGSVDLVGMRRVVEPAPGIAPGVYALTQLRVLVTYWRLLLWPVHQTLDYDYPLFSSLTALPVFLSFIFLSGLLAAAGRSWRARPIFSFGVFWFFISLFPESSFIPIRDVIFEHRLYLALVGPAMAAAWMSFENISPRRRARVMTAFIIIVGILMIASVRRNEVWKDEMTLARDVLRRAPRKARAYKTLGHEFERRGDIAAAIAHYQKALDIDPAYAEVYYNRGNILARQGSLDEAIVEYDTAIRLDPRDPFAYHNRGLVYAMRGDLKRALADVDQALSLGYRAPEVKRNREKIIQELVAFHEGGKTHEGG